MNEEQIQDPNSPSGRATTVSVFEQSNGMNDFPVLKAFQEYIEAEQTRARKRMLGLSIFFVVLLVVVVVTFSVIMAAVINRDQQSLSAIATRNQELSDKLLDIALRERVPQQSVNVGQPQPPARATVQENSSVNANSAALDLQPVLDRLEKLATNLNKPQQPINSVVPTAADSVPVQQTVAAPTLATVGQQDEIRRQREAIAAERAKLKAEQEQLRREQVEQHRRRLYPEYYAQEDARKDEGKSKQNLSTALPKPLTRSAGQTQGQTIPLPVPPPVSSMQKKEGKVKEDASMSSLTEDIRTPSLPAQSVLPEKQKPEINRKDVTAAEPVDLKTAKPISYFDQDEGEGKPPVSPVKRDNIEPNPPSRSSSPATQDVKAEPQKTAPKTQTIAVGAEGKDQIPWLIELPETK